MSAARTLATLLDATVLAVGAALIGAPFLLILVAPFV